MYNNSITDQLLPLITPEMLTRYPDQTCAILNRMARLVQQASTSTGTGGGQGNLEDIIQTTTSYDDGGVNIVTAYLSDGTTQDFQIRNGHQGSQGDDGPAGPANTLSIGTVVSGATADATITGTSPNQTLNLTLPKGDAGAPGPANTLSIGTVASGATADATITGTSPNQTLNLVLPKGDQGVPGADGFSPIANVTKTGDTATITITDENGTTTATVTDGAAGAAATVTAGTTTTLPAGSSATVTNSGTSSAAVFDFGIPKGDTGAAGQDGADGFSPIATVSKSGDTATITITDENGTTTASVTDGSDGAPGAAATISAGTTTTLSPGSSATVTNSGTSSAAVFDFGIPQGATGAPGADGYSPTASVSKVGDTATITITDQNGTTTATVTDGTDGAAGPANTLSIGTVTSGATADATITGTSPNQTLNLVLPKGDPADPPEAIGTADGNPITLTDAGPSIKNINHFYGDTSQQTYTGKNLVNVLDGDRTVGTVVTDHDVDYTLNADGTITVNGTNNTGSTSQFTVKTNVSVLGTGKKLVAEIISGTFSNGVRALCYDNSWNNTRETNAIAIDTPADSSELASGADYNRFRLRVLNSWSCTNVRVRLMVVDNSLTDLSYEPYVGGIPSPNPDYPQAINVVTGTQTVTVSDGNLQSSTYNLRLGSLELCKIGTYQDYIYKSGNDWYVHKAIDKATFNGSENWQSIAGASLTSYGLDNALVGDYHNDDETTYIANSFRAISTNERYVDNTLFTNAYHRVVCTATGITSAANFKTWLGTTNLVVYFALATATDTQITDADLIADLNALNAASLYEDNSVITVTAVSPNLAGTLDIDYWTEFKGEPGSGGSGPLPNNLAYIGSEVSGGGSLIETTDIEDGAITTTKIANSAVSTAKIAGTSVTTAKIANSAVTYAKVDWTTLAWSSTEAIVGYFGAKPIYRRIITGTTPSGSTWTEVLAFGFNIDWVVDFTWALKADGDEYIDAMTMSSSDHSMAVEWYVSGLNSLKVKCNNSYSRSKSFCVKIDYTKA